MCIVSREPGPEHLRIRFARSPDGQVVPDLLRKLPGRGVWTALDRATVTEAVKRKAFSRGFGAEASAPGDLPEVVERLLRQQALAQLSLARKAGQAVQGFVKVDDALRKGPVRVLLHAAEAAADSSAKLDRLGKPETVVCRIFRSDEMDLAFARPNVIHAAIAAGGIAERLVQMIQRLARYDGLDFPGL